MNNFKFNISDQTDLSPQESFTYLNQPVPYDGICIFRCDLRKTGENVGYSVNGVSYVMFGKGQAYSAPFQFYVPFNVKKGDIVSVFGTYAYIVLVSWYKKRLYF